MVWSLIIGWPDWFLPASTYPFFAADIRYRKYNPSRLAATVIAAVRRDQKLEPIWPTRLEEATGYTRDDIDRPLTVLFPWVYLMSTRYPFRRELTYIKLSIHFYVSPTCVGEGFVPALNTWELSDQWKLTKIPLACMLVVLAVVLALTCKYCSLCMCESHLEHNLPIKLHLLILNLTPILGCTVIITLNICKP